MTMLFEIHRENQFYLLPPPRFSLLEPPPDWPELLGDDDCGALILGLSERDCDCILGDSLLGDSALGVCVWALGASYLGDASRGAFSVLVPALGDPEARGADCVWVLGVALRGLSVVTVVGCASVLVPYERVPDVCVRTPVDLVPVLGVSAVVLLPLVPELLRTPLLPLTPAVAARGLVRTSLLRTCVNS